MASFAGTRNAKHWFVFDPCGIICALMAYAMIFFGGVVTVNIIIFPAFGFSFMGVVHTLGYASVVVLAYFSHFRCMTTNPGTVPKGAEPIEFDASTYKECKRCDQTFKPFRAHHCKECQRCILKMDHHCPWINNCVGFYNQKYFLLFVGYVIVGVVYSGALIVYRVASCSSTEGCDEPYSSLEIVGICFLSLMCFMMGSMVACIMADQISSINDSRTQIDKLQNVETGISTKDSWKEVFGEGPWWRHLLPYEPSFPQKIIDRVKGYHIPEKSKFKSDSLPKEAINLRNDSSTSDDDTTTSDDMTSTILNSTWNVAENQKLLDMV